MPITRINRADALPPARSSIDKTTEWTDLLAVLANGLKPFEAVQISAPAALTAMLGGAQKRWLDSFLTATKRHVKKLNLSYDVYRVKNVVTVVGR